MESSGLTLEFPRPATRPVPDSATSGRITVITQKAWPSIVSFSSFLPVRFLISLLLMSAQHLEVAGGSRRPSTQHDRDGAQVFLHYQISFKANWTSRG